MKFNNGFWLLKETVRQQGACLVYDYEIGERTLTLYLPTHPVENKGATLDGALLTVELSSLAQDVIRVRAWRHKGGLRRRPLFAAGEAVPASITDDGDTLTFQSGDTCAVITKTAYQMTFTYRGQTMTASGRGSLAHMTVDGSPYFREELSLDVGETVYGLGERFGAFVKNGQQVDIWNEDGGTCSEQSYVNVPFYLSSKGYGVLVNHTGRVSFEVASEKVDRVQFSVPGEETDYLIFGAAHPKDALTRYTGIAGRPALPPAWSFGLWLSTSFVTRYDEATVMEFIDGMLSRGIPLDVFHFDCCWMKEYEWCSFLWNRAAFPDPARLCKEIHRRGVKVCVWINPYIAQKSPLFEEAMARGYLLRRSDGSVWQWDMWQAGMALVDFTNPEAAAWYQDKLDALLKMGVDCFKTDFGERVPLDVVYYDGTDPEQMHNYYAHLYNQTVFTLLERRRGRGAAVVFARSGTAGGQRFPVHWGGDCTSRYISMAETLRGGLSLALCGYGFWSHDIGGFEDGCTPDLYRRWTQFGLLCSHSRYHGNGQYKVPWLYGDEAVAVTRAFTRLKLSLMPYLFACAVEAAQTGVPMLRPMVLEFPDDETCRYLDRQYMLGGSLLVAPVFREDGTVSFYLPDGNWTGLLDGEILAGGRWYTRQYDARHLPLFVRENSILITARGHQSAAYDYAKDVTVSLYGFDGDCTASAPVYLPDGSLAATVTAQSRAGQISVQTDGLRGEVRVLHGSVPLDA